jgi:hemerythrin-like domain-containing protein
LTEENFLIQVYLIFFRNNSKINNTEGKHISTFIPSYHYKNHHPSDEALNAVIPEEAI